MGFFSKLFGKHINEKPVKVQPDHIEDNGKPSVGSTVLRSPSDDTAKTKKKVDPELTDLELAEQQAWSVKRLPVWRPGDLIAGVYKVEDVREGGMGRVYMCWHDKWRVKVALKSPNEAMLSDKALFARVLREAEAWTEMGMHRNIAYCYFVRTIEEVPHIVVEYVDGGNLEEWIQDGKCIDMHTNMDLAIQFCHAMEYAHSKGMIHRDIKPQNVLMTQNGTLKITDFGLVRSGRPIESSEGQADSAPKDSNLTTIGTFMGTPGYVAPEQIRDAASVDERADIFSFGLCLYEMFCGNKPYETTFGSKQDAPDPVELSGHKDLPLKLAEVLTRCVQWNPSDRYSNFKEIRDTLADIYQDLFEENSAYAELELLDLEADGLNNQGVSYYELDRKDDAVACWEKALKINKLHLEATYNLSLIQWRKAKIADDEVLRRLDNCGNNALVDREKLVEIKANIHMERFAPEEAGAVLENCPGRYDELYSKKDVGQISCVRTLKGHPYSADSVAITPDNRYVVYACFDKTIRLWELKTGRCIRTMEGHTGDSVSVSVTPDGRFAVSASYDTTIRLWELETGRCVHTMEEHTDKVESVSVTPDSRFAVSASWDSTVRLWELETGRCVRIMEGDDNSSANSVSVTPDGRFAISASDEVMWLWELETGSCIRTMEGHTWDVISVAAIPGNQFAVSASGDKTVRLWELETGRCIRTMEGHTDEIHSVAVTPDGRFAVTASHDTTVRLWELETGRCIRTMEGHTDEVTSVAVSPDGRFVVSADSNETVRLWELQINLSYQSDIAMVFPKGYEQAKEAKAILDEMIHEAHLHYQAGHYRQSFAILQQIWEDIGFIADDRIDQLYSSLLKQGSIGSLISIFQKSVFDKHTSKGYPFMAYSVAVTPDSRHVVSVVDGDETVRLWELKTGRCIRIMEGHTNWIQSVAVTPDGRFAVSASIDKTVRLWELETGCCVRTMERPTGNIKSFNFSSVTVTSDGRFVIAADHDIIRLWELETGQYVRTLKGHSPHNISSVAVTPDSRFAASAGSGDKTVRLWELETGHCIRTMEGHPSFVESVTITPDNRYVASGGLDGIIRLWELETGRCVRTMEGHTDDIGEIAVTPDSRFAISASTDKTIRLWELETGRCLQIIEGPECHSVAVTPDSRFVVSAHGDNTIRIHQFVWELEFSD